jgi:hypothetical protein
LSLNLSKAPETGGVILEGKPYFHEADIRDGKNRKNTFLLSRLLGL